MLKEPISIVMPVCNEINVLPDVVGEWLIQLDQLPTGSTIEFDDGDSSDGTREFLSELASRDHRVRVQFSSRDGFSKSIARLFTSAQNDWIFVADSDGQYLSSDLPYFINQWSEGVDFCKGVKVNRQDGLPRRLLSFLMNRFITVVLGLPFLDYNSSHYLINRKALFQFGFKGFQFRNSINVEIALRMILSNCKYHVIYVRHAKRSAGVSRGNPPIKFLFYGIRTIIDIWRLKQSF